MPKTFFASFKNTITGDRFTLSDVLDACHNDAGALIVFTINAVTGAPAETVLDSDWIILSATVGPVKHENQFTLFDAAQ